MLVRTYLGLLADERYAEAWALLTPERQQHEGISVFEVSWRARGHIRTAPDLGPYIWPAADDEVHAEVWLDRDHGGGLEGLRVRLRQVGEGWRVAAEVRDRDRDRLPIPATSPDRVAWQYVGWSFGRMYLPTVEILAQEPFEDGQIVVFRSLNPLLEKGTTGAVQPTATLLYTRRVRGEWVNAGGGTIGTIVLMDRWAVGCAWTWLRYEVNEPLVAAFYCTVEDPRVAAIELTRVDGAVERTEVAGRRAVIFPYTWDASDRWPTQQPQAIRLFDTAGRPLDLPVSPLADEVAAIAPGPPGSAPPSPSPVPLPLPPLDPSAQAARDTWPPLVMVWRETRHVPTPTHQTFRLEYTSLCRYRLTLLEHVTTPPQPGAPHVAGSVQEADGQTVRSHEPWRSPSDTVQPLDPRTCFTPDMHLLIPIAMPPSVRTLASLPSWHMTELGGGLARLSHDEEHPSLGGVIREHVEVTFRVADRLPVLVVSSVDGAETQRREVLELHAGLP